MTRAKQIAALIEQLEQVRLRPPMYFGRIDPALADIYLAGFDTSGYALGLGVSRELRTAVGSERGWRFRSTGFIPSMREGGLTDAQIVDELLVIEIESLRRLTTTRGRSDTAPVDVGA